MYSFIKNNFYLFIAFFTVSWAIINNIPSNEGATTNTKYLFAKEDENLITKQKNEINLRNLNRYRLNTKSSRNQSSSGTAFYLGNNLWMTARHVINECKEVYLKNDNKNSFIEKILIHPNSDLALFSNNNLIPEKFEIGKEISKIAFSSGYPAGNPGDVALEFAGFMAMEARSYNILEKHSIYAVLEKNPRNLLSFGGISGGPAFDSSGNINGVVVAEFTRRGLLGVVGIDQINWLLSASNNHSDFLNINSNTELNLMNLEINRKNYLKKGAELRRNKSISKVICLV